MVGHLAMRRRGPVAGRSLGAGNKTRRVPLPIYAVRS
jgi:hypothetical protein